MASELASKSLAELYALFFDAQERRPFVYAEFSTYLFPSLLMPLFKLFSVSFFSLCFRRIGRFRGSSRQEMNRQRVFSKH